MNTLPCPRAEERPIPRGRVFETTPLSPALLPLLDAGFLLASLWMVYWIELSTRAEALLRTDFLTAALWVIPMKVLWLAIMGEYRFSNGRWEVSRWSRVWMGLLAGSASAAMVNSIAPTTFVPSGSAMVADFLVSVALLLSFRLMVALRHVGGVANAEGARRSPTYRLAVVGCGPAAEALVGDAIATSGGRLAVKCFLSEDPDRWSTTVAGVPVMGPADVLLRGDVKSGLDEVVVAESGVGPDRLLRLQRLALEARLKLRWLPLREPVEVEKVRLSRRRPLEIEDFLEGESSVGNEERLAELVSDRSVLVTGAGGAVGRELGRRLMNLRAERLVLVDLDEDRLCETQRLLSSIKSGTRLAPVLADVQDMPRLHDVFERHQPHLVIHAAVQRQALLMEREPAEAVKSNTLGTVCVATLAMQFRAGRFVLVSSTAAADPGNVVAASRRLAEVFVTSLARSPGNGTEFVVARAGEVVHARSALLTRLRDQVNGGGPVRLHQPESIRKLATAGQVADLILQCAVLGEGGEVFGLDPERAVRTSELAELLILLSGNRPGEDIRLDIIGGLPTMGEASSAITTPSERILPTAHPRIWLNFSPPVPAGHVQRTLYSLFARLHELDADELRRVLLDLVAGYRPTPVIRGNSGDSSSKSPRSGRGQDWQRPELS